MKKITTFLWVDDTALGAAEFYVSIFKKSRMISTSGPNNYSKISIVTFKLDGEEFIAFNGGPF